VADDQFLSFEDALDQLRLQEEELKRLVSEGEIRAFREGDTMKLRAQDVETLREELTGDVDTGASEEIVFEDDVDIVDEAGMATEEITDVETILQEEEVEEVEEVEEIELEEEELLTETAISKRSRRVASGTSDEPEQEGGLVKGALVLTSIIMILGIPVVMAVAKDQISSLARTIAAPITGDTLPAIDDR